jgi:hypothetical protein
MATPRLSLDGRSPAGETGRNMVNGPAIVNPIDLTVASGTDLD